MNAKKNTIDHLYKATLDFLSDPASYPEHPSRIERIETHFSWVFIGDDFVYKLKKPIKKNLYDFTTIEARRLNCQEEYRLNKRLAESIYLDVVPVNCMEENKLELNGKGTVIDWLVKMKKIPSEDMLNTAIQNKNVQQKEIDATALKLVLFYQETPAQIIDKNAYVQNIRKEILDSRRELCRAIFQLDSIDIKNTADLLLQFVQNNQNWFEERVTKGFVKEIHGDLRPEHICIRPKPLFIDCIEFNKDLRILDTADEIAYLALECDLLGRPEIGQRFIKIYRVVTEDPVPDTHLCFLKAYRAMIRARLSIVHLLEKQYSKQDKWKIKAANYLREAGKNVLLMNNLVRK